MNIEKQIIDQRVNKILEDYSDYFSKDDIERNRSTAFLLLGVAAYLEVEIAEAEQYITDGGNDGGFDAAYLEVRESQFNVILFQSKYVRDLNKDSHFPANAVEKAVNTIHCVFDPAIQLQLNPRSAEKVNEIRSFILDGQIPNVTFVMLNNGLSWDENGQRIISNAFEGQGQVQFVHFSHSEILQYVSQREPINTQINLSGKAIQEDFNYKRAIIGRISVKEIFKLMNEYGDDLLEKNIRRYLGRNAVNDGIAQTLEDNKKRSNFFFLNNGVTMTCKQFHYNALQEQNWIVKVENLQIINGGQTCRTIWQTLSNCENDDFSQVHLLVRLYEVDEETIINDITYATNSQNPVDLRDLKSNDTIQKRLEENAKGLGYKYKRKRDNHISTNAKTILSTVAAEAVLAVWREKPYLAKYSKKGDFFDKYYEDIFKNLNAAQMILAVLIFRYCDNRRKQTSINKNTQASRPYSQHFLAYMIGKQILQQNDTQVDELTHNNFDLIKRFFERNKETLYAKAESCLTKLLLRYFDIENNDEIDNLMEIDGRSMAAVFRRFDLVENYFKNPSWWEENMQ